VATLQRSCPVLVGRAAEMALLDRLLDTVVQGHGCLAIITGEAGVGKSRLVREFTSVATEEHGFDTFVGVCRELDRDFPFAPFADALRQRLTEAGVDARDLLGPNSEALALLLPELQRFSGPALPPLSPEQEKRRCFEAVAALLRRLSVRQPLLVVLEDLHWADATTLELLEVLPRRLASTSVLLLLTARSDEPESAFEHCLAKLRRERLADLEVALDPLDQEEVGRMLAAMLPTPPSSSAIAVIHARTDGNPFFVEEIVATAPADSTFTRLASEAVVPRTVREAVLRRLEGLGQATQAVVNLAAVIGQRVDLDLLVAVSDLQQEEVLRTLETLVERHILVERPLPGAHLGGFSFRHALTRDAIYNRLLLVRRRALHRQVAEMLEAASQAAATPGGAADIRHSDLGYHFHAAQQWDKALTYAASAGDAARRLHATNEALVHYQRALDAAQALGSPRTAELDRHCGQCFALLGGFDPARQHLEAALQAARRNGDTALEQGVLYDLAGLYASCDYLQAKEYAQEALAIALAAQDPRLEALALNRLGNIYTNLLQMADARALHEDALQRFHALDDRWGVADCLDLIGMARYLSGEVAEARAAFAQAAAVFEARRLAEEFGPRSVLWQVAASRAQLWRASSPSISTEETRLASAEVSALANAIRESESQQAFRRAPEVRPWAGRTGRQRTAAAASAPGGLTPRERDVVVCIAQGMSNKETARHLYIAEKTVEMHVSSSLGKLGFSSRVQLAAWAVAEGLVPAPQGHGSS
jgi:predicted ATPase/DNA-binding CsgD family transcriptional regulator